MRLHAMQIIDGGHKGEVDLDEFVAATLVSNRVIRSLARAGRSERDLCARGGGGGPDSGSGGGALASSNASGGISATPPRSPTRPPRDQDLVQRSFELLDHDHDGVISPEDLLFVLPEVRCAALRAGPFFLPPPPPGPVRFWPVRGAACGDVLALHAAACHPPVPRISLHCTLSCVAFRTRYAVRHAEPRVAQSPKRCVLPYVLVAHVAFEDCGARASFPAHRAHPWPRRSRCCWRWTLAAASTWQRCVAASNGVVGPRTEGAIAQPVHGHAKHIRSYRRLPDWQCQPRRPGP